VLDAPEDVFASELPPVRQPAPAGTLQRRAAAEPEPEDPYRLEDELYRPQRESLAYRLHLGIPKSAAGKLVASFAILFAFGGVAAAMVAARVRLLHDERFVIASSLEIQIVGNQHLTRGQVLSVFGADLERNIFKVPLAERQADLERLPWIAHATVMRLLPNHIRVNIIERTPVAFVRQGTQIGLVDANGVLLDMPQDAAGDPHYSFPVLTGLSANDPLSTRAARMVVYRQFMQDLDSESAGAALKPSQSVSEIDVSNPEDVKALIASGSNDILVHFGEEKFLERYKLVEANLPQWKTQYPKLASVDTRYEHQFVLEMQQGTPVPLAGSEEGGAVAAPSTAATPPAAAPAAAKPEAAKPANTAAAKTATAKPVAAKPQQPLSAKQKIAAQLAAARKAPPLVASPAAAPVAPGATP
jgi:cell division protein FtsQ